MGPYLLEARFGYHKGWADDAGRNLNYDMSGTLKGIFPKITLKFRKLTQDELVIIAPILDSVRQNVNYFDPNKNKKIDMVTYSGDWELVQRLIGIVEGINCSFISTKKRS